MLLIIGNQPTDKFKPLETVTYQATSADRPIHCLITEIGRYDRKSALVLSLIQPHPAKTLDEITLPKYVLQDDSDHYFIIDESTLLNQNPRPFGLLPANTQPAN